MSRKKVFKIEFRRNPLYDALGDIDDAMYHQKASSREMNDLIKQYQYQFELLWHHFECSPKSVFFLVAIINLEQREGKGYNADCFLDYFYQPPSFLRYFNDSIKELNEMGLLCQVNKGENQVSQFVHRILDTQLRYSDIKDEVVAFMNNPSQKLFEFEKLLNRGNLFDDNIKKAADCIRDYCEKNAHVGFLNKLAKIDIFDPTDYVVLCYCAIRYCREYNSISLKGIMKRIAQERNPIVYLERFTNNSSELFRRAYLEPLTAINNENFEVRISHKLHRDILSDNFSENTEEIVHCDLYSGISAVHIAEKKLFFNPDDNQNIDHLFKLCEKDHFDETLDIFKKKGLKSGLIVLLSGAPGCGKTELAYQIARHTNRTLLRVNINEIKDMWVGNSEKNAMRIFENYQIIARKTALHPILLLNEADGILMNRMTVQNSVDQMNNAIQNIFLQQLEDFEGLCIATTNYEENIDSAFTRRFIYRIRINKPNQKIRAEIIRNRISELSETEANSLAEKFELTGGQIENIEKRCLMHQVINRTPVTYNQIIKFANEESVLLHKAIGFR